LKALGNAVMPQQVYPLFSAIAALSLSREEQKPSRNESDK